MVRSEVRNRALYVTEAVLLVLMIPLGAVWPSIFTLLAFLSLPVLVVAVRAAFRPDYIEPQGNRDPRRGLRRLLHVMAILCMLGEAAAILRLVDAI